MEQMWALDFDLPSVEALANMHNQTNAQYSNYERFYVQAVLPGYYLAIKDEVCLLAL